MFLDPPSEDTVDLRVPRVGGRRCGDEPPGREERAIPGRDQAGRPAAQSCAEAEPRHQRVSGQAQRIGEGEG
jgi:hypothetical protein